MKVITETSYKNLYANMYEISIKDFRHWCKQTGKEIDEDSVLCYIKEHGLIPVVSDSIGGYDEEEVVTDYNLC